MRSRICAANQTLAPADGKYRAEDDGDVIAEGADELREDGEVRLMIATAGDEGGMPGAGACDPPTAQESLRVGEEDDFEGSSAESVGSS